MDIIKDTQVAKVYAAERELKVETEWLRRSNAIAFGQSLFKTPHPAVGPVELPSINVGPTGNRFGAIAMPQRHNWSITISGTSLYKMVITHEAAHLLAYRWAEEKGNLELALHGPEFAGMHLWLVRKHLGPDWAKRLANAYGQSGVRVRTF